MIGTKKKQEEGRKRKVEREGKLCKRDFEKRGKKSAQQAVEAEGAARTRHETGARGLAETHTRLLSKLNKRRSGERDVRSH